MAQHGVEQAVRQVEQQALGQTPLYQELLPLISMVPTLLAGRPDAAGAFLQGFQQGQEMLRQHGLQRRAEAREEEELALRRSQFGLEQRQFEEQQAARRAEEESRRRALDIQSQPKDFEAALVREVLSDNPRPERIQLLLGLKALMTPGRVTSFESLAAQLYAEGRPQEALKVLRDAAQASQPPLRESVADQRQEARTQIATAVRAGREVSPALRQRAERLGLDVDAEIEAARRQHEGTMPPKQEAYTRYLTNRLEFLEKLAPDLRTPEVQDEIKQLRALLGGTLGRALPASSFDRAAQEPEARVIKLPNGKSVVVKEVK